MSRREMNSLMISVTDCLNHLQTSLASIFVSLCDYYFCKCLFILLGTLLTQLFRIRIGNAPEEREMNPNRIRIDNCLCVLMERRVYQPWCFWTPELSFMPFSELLFVVLC